MLGKTLITILTAKAEITAIASNRIYPIANFGEGVSSIYYSVQVTPHLNNNGLQMQDWTIEILTICKTYAEAWNLATLIMRAMHDQRRRTVDGVQLKEVKCTNIRDDYEFQFDTYGHVLRFEVRTNNII